MMSKLLLCFSIFLITSCSQIEDDYSLCDSDFIYCKYFEIKFPELAEITEDNSQLSIDDINTYLKLSNEHANNPNSNYIFDTYTGIFIPRFSYNLVDGLSEEKMWFGLALYPLDKKNDLNSVTDFFYNDDEFGQPTKSIYGDCKKDQGSNFSTSTSALYICSDGQINSYDYWVTDEEFMWKMKCVWREDQFEAINQRLLKVEKINSSDTCRKSFESFKSQVN